jgi:GH25 family lysozyme M1 (1,4-beta-N-acetylmuramidase)
MEKRLIDVSKHNGDINWAKVKADGIDGVIIRAGYGKHIKQKDPCFEKNFKGATEAGLQVGAYWYSYATSKAAAEAEALTFLEATKGKKFELPVYLDIEDTCQVKLPKAVCTDIVNTFGDIMEKAEYYFGVYSFDSFFASNLDESIQEKYTIWAARVENTKPTSVKKYDVWQYSWKGSVDGIQGNVDMDIAYKDFAPLMYKFGFNNCERIETVPETPDVPDNTETPSVPDNTETPSVPENAETPSAPDNTEPNETPETSEKIIYTIIGYRHNVSGEDVEKLTKALLAMGLAVEKKVKED